jgi:hypothetical protein
LSLFPSVFPVGFVLPFLRVGGSGETTSAKDTGPSLFGLLGSGEQLAGVRYVTFVTTPAVSVFVSALS